MSPSLQLSQPQRFRFREVLILNAIGLVPGCALGGCGVFGVLLLALGVLNAAWVPVALGLVPLAIAGTVAFLWPAALGNPYVKGIVRRLPPENEIPGLSWVCQARFLPRLHGGLRGFMEDADDVGRLCISEEVVSFVGDHVRFSLPFDGIKDISHSNCGWRGLWLCGRRINFTTDTFPGYTGIQLLERESNTVTSSKRISRQIIDRLMNRTRQGTAHDGEPARRAPSPPVN